jgi:hypothetical protein
MEAKAKAKKGGSSKKGDSKDSKKGGKDGKKGGAKKKIKVRSRGWEEYTCTGMLT